MRRLILLRHAKAEPLGGHAKDHDRPLSADGEAAARDVGAWLRRQRLVPDLVLCSTARRTRQTWLLAAAAAGLVTVDARFLDGLYDTTVGGVMDVLATVPEPIGTVLLVGHQPTLSQAVLFLSGRRPMEFRPGTLAVLAWTDGHSERIYKPGTASLEVVRAPGEPLAPASGGEDAWA